jgi:hypothetical protein
MVKSDGSPPQGPSRGTAGQVNVRAPTPFASRFHQPNPITRWDPGKCVAQNPTRLFLASGIAPFQRLGKIFCEAISLISKLFCLFLSPVACVRSFFFAHRGVPCQVWRLPSSVGSDRPKPPDLTYAHPGPD